MEKWMSQKAYILILLFRSIDISEIEQFVTIKKNLCK